MIINHACCWFCKKGLVGKIFLSLVFEDVAENRRIHQQHLSLTKLGSNSAYIKALQMQKQIQFFAFLIRFLNLDLMFLYFTDLRINNGKQPNINHLAKIKIIHAPLTKHFWEPIT